MFNDKMIAAAPESGVAVSRRVYGMFAIFLGVFVFSLSTQAWHESAHRSHRGGSTGSSQAEAQPATERAPLETYLTKGQLAQLALPAFLAAIVSLGFAREEELTILPPPAKFDARQLSEITGLPVLGTLYAISTRVRRGPLRRRAQVARWAIFLGEVLVCTAFVVAAIGAVARPAVGRRFLSNPFHAYAQAVDYLQTQCQGAGSGISAIHTPASKTR